MTAIRITPVQRKAHRAEAHHLEPVVMVGADGLTPAVRYEVDAALKAHALIKVRVFCDDRQTRETMLASLADDLGAAPVQHIGKLLVLWRPIPAPEKTLRDDRRPAPRVVKIVSFSKTGNHRATVKKVKVFGNERVTSSGQIKRARPRPLGIKKKAQQQ